MHGPISHTSKRLPDIILRRRFTRLSTTLAVIEGLRMIASSPGSLRGNEPGDEEAMGMRLQMALENRYSSDFGEPQSGA